MKKFLKKMKRFILNNKLLSILILLFFLIIVLGLVMVKILIFPSYKQSKYGNRLDGIEDVKLDDSRFNEIKEKFGTVDGYNIKNIRVSGKIVEIIVSVDDSISVHKAKSHSSKLVECFSEDELKFYDFQVFVTGEGDNYPIIGYKSIKSEGLSWNFEGETNEE